MHLEDCHSGWYYKAGIFLSGIVATFAEIGHNTVKRSTTRKDSLSSGLVSTILGGEEHRR